MGALVTQSVSRCYRNPLIVGVDIGGTNIRARAYPFASGSIEQTDVFQAKLETSNFRHIADVIEEVLCELGKQKQKQNIQGICFGLAGPFDGNKVKLTNQRDWAEVDLDEISQTFGFPYVGGVNDLEATSYGIVAGLSDEDIFILNKGKKKEGGNQAVIAPGTGLGEGIIIEGKYPVPSEGGHSDFAPHGEEQRGLCEYLERKYSDPVCYEDVLSGYGLVNIMDYLLKEHKSQEPEGYYEDSLSVDDKVRLIVDSAINRTNVDAGIALLHFLDILASEAGNLAVKALATGGVFLGGTTKENLSFLQQYLDSFNLRFTGKRKQRELLSKVPVQVITRDDINEYGAAYFVSRRMSK